MKRFTRVLLGVALMLLGIGCVLIVVGKSKMTTMFFEKTPEYHGEVIEADSEEINQIRIDMAYGYLIFEETQDATVTYGMENINKKQLTIEESDGEFYLAIEAEEKELQLGDNIVFYPSVITGIKPEDIPVCYIGVPEDYQGSIEVVLNVGQLTMDGIDGTLLNVSVDCGEIKLTDGDFEAAALTCHMGNIFAGGSFGECFSGTVNIGKLELRLDGSAEDYDLNAVCSIGELDYGNSESDGIDLVWELFMGTGRRLELQVDIGSIEVKFN